MSKALNTIFGIGTAVVIFILVLLGIQAFYPAPVYEDYCNVSYYEPYGLEKCFDNMTVGECKIFSIGQEKVMQNCHDEYDKASKVYNKNLFVITSIIGVILLVVSYFLFSLPNIAAGIAFAGIVLILVGFIRGWQSTNDMLKFVVGVVIAAIVVFFSIKTNKKFIPKKAIKKKK